MTQICNSCGGVIGVDCFNPYDCGQISQAYDEQRYQELCHLIDNISQNLEPDGSMRPDQVQELLLFIHPPQVEMVVKDPNELPF